MPMRLDRGEPRGAVKQQVHLLVPYDLVHEIDELVGNGNRSAFMVKAIREALERAKRKEAAS